MSSNNIIAAFTSQYGHLKKYGLKIKGEANVIGDANVISISIPFIFDNRLIPEKFMGLTIRIGIEDLPDDFKNINKENEYIWAFQRFEKYVDNYSDLIRQKLGNLNKSRDEMLDAICFGDFKAHKSQCLNWVMIGKIPKWIPNDKE